MKLTKDDEGDNDDDDGDANIDDYANIGFNIMKHIYQVANVTS